MIFAPPVTGVLLKGVPLQAAMLMAVAILGLGLTVIKTWKVGPEQVKPVY
jgi:hypothetical protein